MANDIILNEVEANDLIARLKRADELEREVHNLKLQLEQLRNGSASKVSRGWVPSTTEAQFAAWVQARMHALRLSDALTAKLVSTPQQSWSASRIWEVRHGVKGRVGDALRARLLDVLS